MNRFRHEPGRLGPGGESGRHRRRQAKGPTNQQHLKAPSLWTRGGPGDGAFEVVKKLFDDGVMRRDHERGEFDPITETAFKVEGVPNQHSGTAGRRLEDMPAVDEVPVHAVEGEFNEPSGSVCGACVSKIIGLQSAPGQS